MKPQISFKEFIYNAIPDAVSRENLRKYIRTILLGEKNYSALMICGEGGSDKSLLLQIIKNVIGEKNTIEASPRDLSRSLAVIKEMQGKTVLLSEDLPSVNRISGLIKSMIDDCPIRIGSKIVSDWPNWIYTVNEIPKEDWLIRRSNGVFMCKTADEPNLNLMLAFSNLRKENLNYTKKGIEYYVQEYLKTLHDEISKDIESVRSWFLGGQS